MTEKKASRLPPRIEALPELLSRPLEDEGAVLDTLVMAMAKGDPHPELWERFHDAVLRDDRIAELAFAYERLASDRRLRSLSGPSQAEVMLHAARFFQDLFGDGDGAEAYLRKALSGAPGHEEAFERLEKLLVERNDAMTLAEAYEQRAAAAVERSEQASYLRKAAAHFDAVAGQEDRALKTYQQVLKLDPNDVDTRTALESRFLVAGKYAEVAKLLEQALLCDPLPEADEEYRVRERLLDLYATRLGEIERAMPHVEHVLERNAQHDQARDVAERLLGHRAVAPRAAAALEPYFEQAGDWDGLGRVLALQVDQLRGPKRVDAQKRLAVLRYDQLGDAASALPILEQLVVLDPADEAMRKRLRAAAELLEKLPQATRTLARAATSSKDQAVRASINIEVAELYDAQGDAKKARAVYQSVLDAGGEEPAQQAAQLAAARALDKLCDPEREGRLLAKVLSTRGQLEPEMADRVAAAERLAELCEGQLRDTALAVSAWRMLLDTDREDAALEALERLYAASGEHAELVFVLDRRAARGTGEAAQADLLRAATIASEKLDDDAGSRVFLQRALEQFGPSREVYGQLVVVLEKARDWEQLFTTLQADAALAPPEERSSILLRAAQVVVNRTDEPGRAVPILEEVLTLDPTEKTARAALERMLGQAELRLAAAQVLEPIYRNEGNDAALSKLLEVRANMVDDEPGTRLSLLWEAAAAAEASGQGAKRAQELIASGLGETAYGSAELRGGLTRWMQRFDELLPPGVDPPRRASLLLGAMGGRGVESDAAMVLAKACAEALVACGDVPQALSVYRSALELAPSAPDLLSRVDELLQEEGSPEERLALYRSALDQPCDPSRRRELRHAIASILRRDIGDPNGAVDTYRIALDEDDTDAAALLGLKDSLAEAGRHAELYDLIVSRLEGTEGAERLAELARAAEAAEQAGHTDAARSHLRELLESPGEVPSELLSQASHLAASQGDHALLAIVYGRRAEAADDSDEELEWLERLGVLKAEHLEEPDAAVEVWRGAAEKARERGDTERAQRLFERVIDQAPGDRHAAKRLIEVYRELGDATKLAAAYLTLLAATEDDLESASIVLAMEQACVGAGRVEAFVERVDELTERPGVDGVALRLAKARVLSSDPSAQPRAAAAYRASVEAASSGDPNPALEAMAAFLHARATDPSLYDDRRWLFRQRAELVADSSERISVLLEWALTEEREIGDETSAAEVYKKVLLLDPDHDEALAARARLLLAQEAFDDAVELLSRRIELHDGQERAALSLQVADILLHQKGDPASAFDVAAPVLDEQPGDANAFELILACLAHESVRERAAIALGRAVESVEEAEPASLLFARMLEETKGAPGLSDHRAQWYEARLDRIESPDRALEVAIAGATELPGRQALWDRAETLSRELGRPEAVARAYLQILEDQAPDRPDDFRLGVRPEPAEGVEPLDPETMEAVGQRAVEFHEEWFDDPETVAEMLRRILAVAPLATWAFERLKLAYNAAERWTELFSLYDRVIACVHDVEYRAELLEDAAQAAKDFAGDSDRSIEYFAALYTLRPADTKTAAVLERLYERKERWPDLLQLLNAQIPHLHDPEEIASLRLRIATLELEKNENPNGALIALEELLTEGDALPAYQLLERVLEATVPREADDEEPPVSMGGNAAATGSRPPSPRERSAMLLKEWYRDEGRTEDVVRMLHIELEGASGAKSRIRRLKEIATIQKDQLEDLEAAFATMSRIVHLDPRASEMRAELAALASATSRFSQQVDVLLAAVDRVDERKHKRALVDEAFEITLAQPEDRARAVAAGKTLLELVSDDDERTLAVGRKLEPLLDEENDKEDLAHVLEVIAKVETARPKRRDALLKAAELTEAMGDDERALASLAKALDDEPRDREALDRSIALFAKLERHEELIEKLKVRIGILADAADKRADEGQIAKSLRLLGRADDAISAWNDIRSKHGPDDESADELFELLSERGDPEELASQLYEEAKRESRPERAARLWWRLGELERKRERFEASFDAFCESIEHDPTFERTRAGLGQLVFSLQSAGPPELFLKATQKLCDLLEEGGLYDELVRLVDVRLEAHAPGDHPRIWLATSRVYEEHLEDPVQAFDAAFAAFALDPAQSVPASRVLELAEPADGWTRKADAFRKIANDAQLADSVARPLWQALAEHELAQGHREHAEHALRKALEVEPRHPKCLRRLVELLRMDQDETFAAALLELADLAPDDELALRQEHVQLHLDTLAQRDEALACARSLIAAANRRAAALAEAGEDGDTVDTEESAEAVDGAIEWALGLLLEDAEQKRDDEALRSANLVGARSALPSERKRELLQAAADLSAGDEAIELFEELFRDDPRAGDAGRKLEVLYRMAERPKDLIRLRERQIEVAADTAERTALRLELASLHVEQQGRPEAIAILRTSLEEAPDDDATLMRLSDLLEELEAFEDLHALWESRAERATEVTQLGSELLWEKAGALAEERLEDPVRALADYEQALALGAGGRSLDAIARLSMQLGAPARAAEVLEELWKHTADQDIKSVTARLCEALLAIGDTARARARLEAALKLAPTDAELLDQLGELYRAEGAFDKLADLFVQRARHAGDKTERVELLGQAADLHLEVRDSPESALTLLEEIASLLPEDAEAQLRVADALRAAGRLDDAGNHLRSLIEGYGGRRPKERALAHFAMAQVALTSGDRAKALSELDLAVKIDPGHPDVLHSLANLALEEGQLARAQRMFRALLLVLRSHRVSKRSQRTKPIRKTAILFELSVIAERQGEGEKSKESMESAFEAAAEDLDEARALVEVAAEGGRNDRHARAIDVLLSHDLDRREAGRAHVALADVKEQHLSDGAGALESRLAALRLDPADSANHAEILRLCRDLSATSQYLSMLDTLVAERLEAGDAGDAEHRLVAQLLLAQGRLYEQELADPGQARQSYERAEKLAREHSEDAEVLVRVLEAQEVLAKEQDDREVWIEVLTRWSQLDIEGFERVDVAEPMSRLSLLLLEREESRDRGCDTLERAIGIDREEERLRLTVEKALATAGDHIGVLRIAESFYQQREEIPALIQVLQMTGRAEGASSPAWREAVDKAVEASDKAKAAEVLAELTALLGDDASDALWAFEMLAALSEESGQLAEAADLRERAARAGDPETERRLLLSVAELCRGPLQELPRAAEIYEELRSREPAERELWEPLATVYRTLNESAKLAELLSETIPLIDEQADRSALRLEQAELSVKDDPARARQLLTELIEEDPGHVQAGQRLAALLEAEGNEDELMELLRTRLDAAKDREDKATIVDVTIALGARLEQREEDDEALDIYHAALDWDPNSRSVLRAIVRLSVKRDDSLDLGDALDRLLSVEQGDEAVSLARQLADIRGAHQDHEGALRALEQGYRASPEDSALRDELITKFTEAEAWDRLVDVLTLDAEAQTNAEERAKSFKRAATVRRQQQHDLPAAEELLIRALEAQPGDREALFGLIDVSIHLGTQVRARDALTRAIEQPDGSMDAWLFRSRASMHEATADSEAALSDLENAFELSRGEYREELLALLAHLADADEQAGERAQARTRRLRLCEVRALGGELDLARDQLLILLKADLRDREVLWQLADLEARAGRWDAVSSSLRRIISVEEGERLVEAALRLAEACDRAGRPEDARGGLERAYKAHPDRTDLRDKLVQAYDAAGAYREWADLVVAEARNAQDVQEQFEGLVHGARVLLKAEDEGAEAVNILEEARGLKPEDPSVTLALSEAYAQSGRSVDARQLLVAAIDGFRARRSVMAARYYEALARIELQDGNLSESLDALHRAFDNDPHNAALALELGRFAIDLDETELATRAFRTLTMMKGSPEGGVSPESRAIAYFHLGQIAHRQGDVRRARLMLEKALVEDPNLAVARELLDSVRGG